MQRIETGKPEEQHMRGVSKMRQRRGSDFMLFTLPVEQWGHYWYIQMKKSRIACYLSTDAFQ